MARASRRGSNSENGMSRLCGAELIGEALRRRRATLGTRERRRAARSGARKWGGRRGPRGRDGQCESKTRRSSQLSAISQLASVGRGCRALMLTQLELRQPATRIGLESGLASLAADPERLAVVLDGFRCHAAGDNADSIGGLGGINGDCRSFAHRFDLVVDFESPVLQACPPRT